MKKTLAMTVTVTVLTAMLAGCGGTASSAASSTPAATAAPAASPADEKPAIRSEELHFQNGEKDIYGVIYLPAGEQETYPTVIMSHGFGGVCEDNKIYAEKFAELGYVCYSFDYCGGGRGSRSDGDMTEMSILSEKEDLFAVMDGIKALDYVDPDNLFLFGQSQGGFVSSLAAADRAGEVKALIMLYPAYALQDECWERHGSIENVPETESFMNNTLGAIYSLDAMSFDAYEVIGSYTGPVLILHGDQDDVVSLDYSERAVEVYENAELVVLEGTGHGFSARQKEAAGIIAPWLQEHTGAAD